MLKNQALIQLKINQNESSNYCNSKYFTVILHWPSEIPTPFHETYSFEYGRDVKFRLSVINYRIDKALRRFAPLSRNCYFDEERKLKFFKSYSKAHCDFECMTNFTLKHCGCVKFSMPRNAKTRVCSWVESNCYNEAMEMWSVEMQTINTDKPCDCLSTCTDLKYSLKIEADTELEDEVANTYISSAKIVISDNVAVVHETIDNYKLQNFM